MSFFFFFFFYPICIPHFWGIHIENVGGVLAPRESIGDERGGEGRGATVGRRGLDSGVWNGGGGGGNGVERSGVEWRGPPPPLAPQAGPSRRCVGSLRRTSAAADAFAEGFGHALGRVAARQGGTKGEGPSQTEGARARARARGGTCGAACGLGRAGPPVAEDAARIVDGNRGRSASVSDRVCRTPYADLPGQ